MNSALAALIGLSIAIILIIRKLSPVYSLMLGAFIGGVLSGWGLDDTVMQMITGVKDITPAIVRILAAGVLSGMLIRTGSAARISKSIISVLGERHVLLALALSSMLLTSVGVFIDVAVITIAPIALMAGGRLGIPKPRLLLAMIGGGKCGNIISPNPNTIIASENFGTPLSSVMAANIIPALVGLAFTVYVLVPLMPKVSSSYSEDLDGKTEDDEKLPSFFAAVSGPLAAIALLALRPLAGIVVDPLVALPAGGVVGLLATGRFRDTAECLGYGLGKMSSIAVLLVGTGTIAGVIKASAIKDVLVSLLAGWSGGGTLMASISGALMCCATASTTAGATIASASFSQTILAAGVSAVWGAAMVNSGATVLDHLPHGSFFHATGGSVGMNVKERLRLIPYESAVGLVLASGTVICYLIFG